MNETNAKGGINDSIECFFFFFFFPFRLRKMEKKNLVAVHGVQQGWNQH